MSHNIHNTPSRKTNFGKFIDDNNLTYGVVSSVTGLSKSMIWNYANGIRKPDLDTALLIIKKLNININYIYDLFNPI